MDYVRLPSGDQLFLELADDYPPNGRVLDRIAISLSDLQSLIAATWWEGMRRGVLQEDWSNYKTIVRAGPTVSGLINGCEIQLCDRHVAHRRHFPVTTLRPIAQRSFNALVARGAARITDSYHFYLTTAPAAAVAEPTQAVQVKSDPAMLQFGTASLEKFLAASELVPSSSAAAQARDPMPTFVTREAWEAGRQEAYRGGANESAGLFSGRVFRDTETPELFVCLEACLPVAHAVEQTTAVHPTADTWATARQWLAQRRRRLNRPNEVFVASVHRHPWLPAIGEDGSRQCEACPSRAQCTRTTAQPSSEDFELHTSVFGWMPWVSLIVYGYTAREEEDVAAFALDDGVFLTRPMRILDDASLLDGAGIMVPAASETEPVSPSGDGR